MSVNSLSLRRTVVAALLSVILACTQLSAQKPSVSYAPSNRESEQVFDLLFPRDVLETVGTYSFVLRYEPSFKAESQITFVKRGDRFEVIEYVSANGSIEEQMNKILESYPRATPRMMARKIKVTQRKITITNEEGTRWRDDFYASACPAFGDDKLFYNGKATTVILDGARYQLWYNGMGLIHYDFSGSWVDSSKGPNEEPVVTWMKNIYRRVHEIKSER